MDNLKIVGAPLPNMPWASGWWGSRVYREDVYKRLSFVFQNFANFDHRNDE